MKLLAFECSAKAASCAVLEDGKVLGSAFSNVQLTHSQTLMPMMQNVLSSIKLTPADIDAFAVAAGPGSFTGIRIGISAVKGLAAAKKLPCYPVSTLLAMAHIFAHENAFICPVMDARCQQVYNALFRARDGKIERLCEDRALSLDELATELSGIERKVILVGDGAHLIKERISIVDEASLCKYFKVPYCFKDYMVDAYFPKAFNSSWSFTDITALDVYPEEIKGCFGYYIETGKFARRNISAFMNTFDDEFFDSLDKIKCFIKYLRKNFYMGDDAFKKAKQAFEYAE